MEQQGWSVLVPVSADRVYERLLEFTRMPEYVDGVAEVRRGGDDLLRISGGAGNWELRIAQAMPARGLVLEPVDPAGPGLRFMLEPGEGGTSVTVRATHTHPAQPLAPDRDRLRAFLLEDPGAG